MQDRDFSSFASNMMKLSVNETKWSSLLARNRVLILYISIWIFDFGPEKLPGLSRNGPLAVTLIGCRKRRKLKALYPRGWIREWSAVRGEKDPFFCLFLLFYGLMVGKYALICAMEIRKIHMVVHIFSWFALVKELMWVYRGVESLCRLLTANVNKVPFDLPTNEWESKYCSS